jgi:hypothetical protein
MKRNRVRLKDSEAIALGFTLSKTLDDGNSRYRLTPEQEKELQLLRNFYNTNFIEVKRTLNKDGEVISKVEKLAPDDLIKIPDNHEIKRVSTNVSTKQQWVITEPIKHVNLEKEIDFTNIFKELVKPVILGPKENVNLKALFDRAVYTDTHVGMEVNQNGYSLYDGSWDEIELLKRLYIFVDEIVKNQKSNTLLLHDLGDLMDGYDGFTTRGGHKLPQNMDNQRSFDVALRFKILMIDELFKYYDKIECVDICDDNHGGSFTYIVNSAFKTYIELKYPKNITVINQRKFIDHYIYGKRCFILTHGKDSKSLKFGFKPKLDPVQIEKIKNYIDEYRLHQYEIEFSKGDSHQLLFDWTSSTAFEYQNFGAFSPPSDWVKTNFKNTSSSFVTFNYFEDQKTINTYIFKK